MDYDIDVSRWLLLLLLQVKLVMQIVISFIAHLSAVKKD